MKTTIGLLILFLLISANANNYDSARSQCIRVYGQGSRVWSKSFLGIRCLTPEGYIRRLS